ncbi:MAG: rod shape-determining protein MreD [Bacteroidota bacterium]
MIESLPRNVIRFIVLVLIQVFIFNNIQLNGYLNPYIYILFIILLPFSIPKWMLLSLSFFIGIVIDLFTHTPGMHTAACVFIGFVRPLVLSLFAPREGYTSSTKPQIIDYGTNWFIKYAGIMTFLHHLILFYVEVFGFSHFFNTLGRVIFSSIFTLLIITISQLLVARK